MKVSQLDERFFIIALRPKNIASRGRGSSGSAMQRVANRNKINPSIVYDLHHVKLLPIKPLPLRRLLYIFKQNTKSLSRQVDGWSTTQN